MKTLMSEDAWPAVAAALGIDTGRRFTRVTLEFRLGEPVMVSADFMLPAPVRDGSGRSWRKTYTVSCGTGCKEAGHEPTEEAAHAKQGDEA